MALVAHHAALARILASPKCRGIVVVRACYRARRESQIPKLMRYIPGQKPQPVHLPIERNPQQQFENSDDDSDSIRRRFRKGSLESDEETYGEQQQGKTFESRHFPIERQRQQKTGNSDGDFHSIPQRFCKRPAEAESDEEDAENLQLTCDERVQEKLSRTTERSRSDEGCEVISPVSYEETIRALNLRPASEVMRGSSVKPTMSIQERTKHVSASKVTLQWQSESEEHEDENEMNLEDEDDVSCDDDVDMKIKELTTSDNPGEKSAARSYAIFLLGQGNKTAAELKKKLRGKDYSVRVVEQTISELRELGFQSDATYAENFTQSRWNAKGWSSKRIKYELLRKGVEISHIDRALKNVFRTEDSGKVVEDEDELKWDMSKSAQEHILALAARKWNAGGNIADDVRNRRLAGWLQRRGFGWKEISGILNAVQGRKPVPLDQGISEEE